MNSNILGVLYVWFVRCHTYALIWEVEVKSNALGMVKLSKNDKAPKDKSTPAGLRFMSYSSCTHQHNARDGLNFAHLYACWVDIKPNNLAKKKYI